MHHRGNSFVPAGPNEQINQSGKYESVAGCSVNHSCRNPSIASSAPDSIGRGRLTRFLGLFRAQNKTRSRRSVPAANRERDRAVISREVETELQVPKVVLRPESEHAPAKHL